MTQETILKEIKKTKPKIIYISGKTATGKTTFSNELKRIFNYSIIELDSIVVDSVIKPLSIQDEGEVFVTVYRDTEPKEYVETFIKAAHEKISKTIKNFPVIVEGAVASPRVLQEIFTGDLKDFIFIYFHPVSEEAYSKRIESRLISGVSNNTFGLPKRFWSLVEGRDFNDFKETGELNDGIKCAVSEYALSSMAESSKRLEEFKKHFSNIQVIEV